MNIMSGLVVLEGIDGCGKSTVAELVAARLGKRAWLTQEPTNSWLGMAVRKGDKAQTSPYTDALLFMADRAQHTLEISRKISHGKLVVCDRYYHSTVAYQAVRLRDVFEGDAFEWLLRSNLGISLHPDLTVLLTIPPKLGLLRIAKRKKLSRFEKEGFLREVHRNYLKLARLDRSIVKVDARQDIDTIVEQVLSLIEERNI